MRNQLRADFYKLRHSSTFWIVGGLFVILFVFFCMMSTSKEGVFFGFARENINNVPVLDGFVAFSYLNPSKPTMWEIVYSATLFTFFLWIVLLVLTIQFYSKEFSTGTVKLSIAYGKNRLMLYFSKLIVIVTYFGILYYLFQIMAYFVSAHQIGAPVTVEGIIAVIKLTTLFFMALIIFTMLAMLLYNIFQNTVVVSTCMVVYMYSLVFLILGIMDKAVPPILQLYFNINPMYYLWRASGFWAFPSIAYDTIIYFVVGIIVITICTYFVQVRKEVK